MFDENLKLLYFRLMRVDQFNFNNLRVFETVYRERSMTSAARILHLTQSGVSQHIISLEESVGVKLFDRVSRKILPTEAGKKLYHSSRPALLELEQAVAGLHEGQGRFMGAVHIGMPVNFGTHVLIPQLAKTGVEHPDLQFDIVLDSAAKLAQGLYDGHLDFAIVDSYQFDKSVAVEPISSEMLLLCGHESYLSGKGAVKLSKSFLESLDYVTYQDGEMTLRSWMVHHLKRKHLNLNVRARVMDVNGVTNFITNGLGLGILPHHHVDHLKRSGVSLQVIQGKQSPLKNEISLVYLKDRSKQPAVEHIKQQMREVAHPTHFS